jgi:hypothetical protein
MARWRLTAKHYIHVIRGGEKSQWVREETNRDTGRVARTTYLVPTYLDPDAPADQNYPGEIVVSRAKGAQARDLIFEGQPTFDMEPLDEEAEAITAQVKAKGGHPIDDLPTAFGESYGERLLSTLSTQLEKVMSNGPPVYDKPPENYAALEAEVAKLKAENAKLNAVMGAKKP